MGKQQPKKKTPKPRVTPKQTPAKIWMYPYCKIDGVRNYSDTFIKAIFQRMEAEGLVETVFFDASVKTAEGFLQLFKHSETMAFVLREDSHDQVLGAFWLDQFAQATAYIHFVTFNNFRGDRPRKLGRQVLQGLLDLKDANGRTVVGTIFGLIMEANRPAAQFAKDVGMQQLAVLPASCWDGYNQKHVNGVLFRSSRKE